MNRREALTATAALMGSAIIGSQAFLSGCSRSETKVEGFSDDVLALLDEIGETILPATASSPGAKASKIGEFMKIIVTDCYSPAEQKTFFEGISVIQETQRKSIILHSLNLPIVRSLIRCCFLIRKHKRSVMKKKRIRYISLRCLIN